MEYKNSIGKIFMRHTLTIFMVLCCVGLPITVTTANAETISITRKFICAGQHTGAVLNAASSGSGTSFECDILNLPDFNPSLGKLTSQTTTLSGYHELKSALSSRSELTAPIFGPLLSLQRRRVSGGLSVTNLPGVGIPLATASISDTIATDGMGAQFVSRKEDIVSGSGRISPTDVIGVPGTNVYVNAQATGLGHVSIENSNENGYLEFVTTNTRYYASGRVVREYEFTAEADLIDKILQDPATTPSAAVIENGDVPIPRPKPPFVNFPEPQVDSNGQNVWGFTGSTGRLIIRRANGDVINEPEPGTQIFLGDSVEAQTETGATFTLDDSTEITLEEGQNVIFQQISLDLNTPAATTLERRQTVSRVAQLENQLFQNRDADVATTFVGGPANGIKEHDVSSFVSTTDAQFANSTELGFRLETASPASISTLVELDQDPFNLSFDYILMDDAMDFSVLLGELELFSTSAAREGINTQRSIELAFDPFSSLGLPTGQIYSQLTFEINGAASKELLLWDVIFNGKDLTEVNSWSHFGDVEYTFITDQVGFENLSASPAPVPLPATSWLLIAALGSGAILKRKKSQN